MSGNPKKKVKETPKHKTNRTKGSLVKVVVIEDLGKWKSPNKGETFFIDENATFPDILFEIETDETGPYSWSWNIMWAAKVSGIRESAKRGSLLKTFNANGTFTQESKSWAANLINQIIGGILTVEIKAGDEKFKRSVFIKGKNPGEARAKEFLSTIPDVAGFDKLLKQESNFKNFIHADNEPVVAFDRGYGMTQMTNPAPTYEQIWNWKANLQGGIKLYQQKQKEARSYLGQKGRPYTTEQLTLETWTRWNGGTYHIWDAAKNAWIRNSNILCDSQTGNIGWDMKEAENKDKTEAELQERDRGSYANPKKDKKAENKWRYTGVCYADHVNDH